MKVISFAPLLVVATLAACSSGGSGAADTGQGRAPRRGADAQMAGQSYCYEASESNPLLGCPDLDCSPAECATPGPFEEEYSAWKEYWNAQPACTDSSDEWDCKLRILNLGAD